MTLSTTGHSVDNIIPIYINYINDNNSISIYLAMQNDIILHLATHTYLVIYSFYINLLSHRHSNLGTVSTPCRCRGGGSPRGRCPGGQGEARIRTHFWRSLASRRGQDKHYVFVCFVPEGPQMYILPYSCFRCAHFATNTVHVFTYTIHFATFCRIIPWTFVMGNCGTSVMTPFVLTLSGSCQQTNRHCLNGYLDHRLPSLFLASTRKCLNYAVLKCMLPELALRLFYALTSCTSMGSTRSGSYSKEAKSSQAQATPREFRHEGC